MALTLNGCKGTDTINGSRLPSREPNRSIVNEISSIMHKLTLILRVTRAILDFGQNRSANARNQLDVL
jgi:hypothetical protein